MLAVTRAILGAPRHRMDPVRAAAAVCAVVLLGCRGELGECNTASANELVYGRGGLVATKGQALAHDSCGNGAFCHSAAAKGALRHGAPARMDFDMLPAPRGLSGIRELAEDAWQVVQSEQMPPSNASALIGDGAWLADVERRTGAAALPPLPSHEGKAIFRNWLACGAPVVTETRVPAGVQPLQHDFDAGGGTPTWSLIYRDIMQPRCATAGCHNAQSAAGGLALAQECAAYAALFEAGSCGELLVRSGDADGSLLVDKLESEAPRCGTPMPPAGPLPEAMKVAVRAWIEAGAEADSCP
jgi:hypothetical protein